MYKISIYLLVAFWMAFNTLSASVTDLEGIYFQKKALKTIVTKEGDDLGEMEKLPMFGPAFFLSKADLVAKLYINWKSQYYFKLSDSFFENGKLAGWIDVEEIENGHLLDTVKASKYQLNLIDLNGNCICQVKPPLLGWFEKTLNFMGLQPDTGELLFQIEPSLHGWTVTYINSAYFDDLQISNDYLLYAMTLSLSFNLIEDLISGTRIEIVDRCP